MTRQTLSGGGVKGEVFNLKEATSGRYKIVLEESWDHERFEVRQQDRRWYERIPCKGEAWVGLFCETRANCSLGPAGCCYRSCQPGKVIMQLWTPRVKNARGIWEKLSNAADCKADWMDGEAVLYFPAELVNIVAEMADARKKRRLSPEARTKLKEAGKATQFQHRICGVEGEKAAQI